MGSIYGKETLSSHTFLGLDSSFHNKLHLLGVIFGDLYSNHFHQTEGHFVTGFLSQSHQSSSVDARQVMLKNEVAVWT